jgi:aspartate-semialdehyde dehydrogenase
MTYKVGILGATGAVGQEIIHLLHERAFPFSELRLLASARSAGKVQSYNEHTWTIEETTEESFKHLDICIFSAGGSQSQYFAPIAKQAGCLVIDNSSAFRMDDSVPLVVPEINPEAALNHDGLIANPNCSTAISLMGLYPFHKAFGLKSVIACTYQAVSGSGAEALKELDDQLMAWSKGETLAPEVYPHPIAFNVIPHVDSFNADGFTREEMKLLNESKKIMNLDSLEVNCTCVRVPVRRAHSIAITASFGNPIDLEVAKQAIHNFPNVELVDNPEQSEYPMPINYSEVVPCAVGRMRKTDIIPNGLSFWVTGDQLWKGAALNAIQIAELLVKENKVR